MLVLDDTHAAEGVYVVRLWAEDSTSDDDWAVITVDDRLPCDDEGQPAFARGAREGALWAAIVEKAVAKRFGSYSKLATTTTPASTGGGVPMDGDESTLRGLELVTGGKARPLEEILRPVYCEAKGQGPITTSFNSRPPRKTPGLRQMM